MPDVWCDAGVRLLGARCLTAASECIGRGHRKGATERSSDGQTHDHGAADLHDSKVARMAVARGGRARLYVRIRTCTSIDTVPRAGIGLRERTGWRQGAARREVFTMRKSILRKRMVLLSLSLLLIGVLAGASAGAASASSARSART